MKNYGDRGGCYPSRPVAEADNTLRDRHNSSYDTKAEFNNCFIIQLNNSQFKNMPTSIEPLMLSSSSIVHVQVCPALQIFSKQQMSPFELSSCCSRHVFSYFFAQFLTLETSEMSAIFKFTTKTTQPRPQVFSVNGALTCTSAAFLTSFPRLTQNSSKFGHQKLVMVNYACAFSQSESGKYFE